MKIELYYLDNHCFQIEPENEIEKCAFAYLRDRPKTTIEVDISGIGKFVPLDTDLVHKAKAEYMRELQSRRGEKKE